MIQEMLARFLVPGDLVYISVGDRIPADIRLTEVRVYYEFMINANKLFVYKLLFGNIVQESQWNFGIHGNQISILDTKFS